MEVVSNTHSTPITFDVNKGQLMSYDKALIPDLQYESLIESLMNHKGGKMSLDFLHSFEELAGKLAKLPFRENLVRYSIVNDFVNISMVFDRGVELEVTQFPDVEEVAFSIHYDDATLAVATAKGEVLTERMLGVLKEMMVNDIS